MSLITCAELAEVQLKLDQVWADARVKADYEPNAESAIALIENTTAKFQELQGAKDKEIGIKWLNYCDAGVQECTDNCSVTPDNEIAAGCLTYTMDICQETKGFIIDETDLRNKIWEFQDLVAVGMLKEIKALDEYWAEKSITMIETMKGENVYTDGVGDVSGTETYLAAALWSPDIMGEFALTAKLNKFSSPFLLSGKNLYLANWNAQMNVGDQAAGAKARINTMKMYSDVFNVDSVNTPDKKTYMIQRGSIGFFTKAYYGQYSFANPLDMGQFGKFFSVPSKTLPGVTYDVIYNLTCVNGHFKHAFKLQTHGMISENPLGCDPTNTGILSFTCGVRP